MTIEAWRFPTALRFGPGARERLCEFRDRFGARKPLVVTDEGLVETDAYRRAEATVAQVWPESWTRFCGVHSNPTEADVATGFEQFRAAQCDSIVAVGGGSAIDAGKAILLAIARPDQRLSDIALAELPGHIAPLCALPTTAGTGSEVGQSAVISSSRLGRKLLLGAPALLPQLAILDPELTLGLPARITAATGMDAMTHAIESFVCPVFHPMCDGIALEAIYRIRTWLPQAVADGSNLEARGQMLVAAAMGAVAFQKDLGAAHSMAHALGIGHDIHHGLANAVVLATTIRFNGETDRWQYARVAAALGVDANGDPASAVASAIEALNREIGIAPRLRDLGIESGDIPGLVDIAVADPCHATNPRPCSAADFTRLFSEAL
jgi:hypothetical protein